MSKFKVNDVVIILNTDGFYEKGKDTNTHRFLYSLGLVTHIDDSPLPCEVRLYDDDGVFSGVDEWYFQDSNLEKVGVL